MRYRYSLEMMEIRVGSNLILATEVNAEMVKGGKRRSNKTNHPLLLCCPPQIC